MTDSYRKIIAEAAREKLLGKTIAGDNIYTSLDRQLAPDKDLPALMIWTGASRRGQEDYGQAIIPRRVTLNIEGGVLAPAFEQFAAAEALAESIEIVMDGDRSLGQIVNDCTWQQTISDATSHGAHTMGVCIVQYEVEIFTHVKPDGYFELGDDGFTQPPSIVHTVPDVVMPSPPDPDGSLCGPDGCDIPAWGGEGDIEDFL